MDTKIFLLAFLLLTGVAGNSQKKLVLKPGLVAGFGFNHISNRLTAEHSFRSPRPGFTLSLSGRAEFYFSQRSFIELGIRGTEAAYSFSYGIKNTFSDLHQTGVALTQVNAAFNRFFKKEHPLLRKFTEKPVALRFKYGGGLGFNWNQDDEYYQMYFSNKFSGASTSSGLTHWRRYTARPGKKIGFHLFGRIGLSVMRGHKELFDLQLEYNQGLSKITSMELEYGINGSTYRAALGSRGTHLNLTAGLPITLLRFSK